MANKNLQGTIEYYIKGQYGLIKGEDGKEYCFGRKAVTARAKLFNGEIHSRSKAPYSCFKGYILCGC